MQASYSVFRRMKSQQGYMLLKCIRRYIVLDILASLEVHMGATLRLYAAQLVKYSQIIQVYHILAKCIQPCLHLLRNMQRNFLTKIGISQKTTLISIFLTISLRRALARISTRNPSRKCMGPLKEYIKIKQISRMLKHR